MIETTDTAKTESSDVSTESSATTTTIQSAFSTTDATTTSKGRNFTDIGTSSLNLAMTCHSIEKLLGIR
ncbi:unnamed protein product [Clavelina lepadiformis]|uniref:Carrier domain-containing protein n=1 Tax=Clavelina lepadiformis TaxID=159417 RepID=A0ABP0G3K9_CLALP